MKRLADLGQREMSVKNPKKPKHPSLPPSEQRFPQFPLGRAKHPIK
uniref:Uncharacterized protein n=1 Tax=Rhizophora mucronata TaxID=61149 RepID=A0A2P2ITW4_RHIMU